METKISSFFRNLDSNIFLNSEPHNDPWKQIKSEFNTTFNTNLSIKQIVDLYQKSNCNFFYNNYPISDNINRYFIDKKVIIVGPSKFIEGKGLGSFIDSFDIVIRMDINYLNTNTIDYGNKLSLLAHNLNDKCRPNLESYLNNDKYPNPDYIISSDSAIGNGRYIYNIKDDFQKKYNVPIIDLENNKKYNFRNKLYWEIYATKYNEKYNKESIKYIENFSSGYGIINMLLGYKITELFVIGMDFYNIGLSNNSLTERYCYNYFEKNLSDNRNIIQTALNGGLHNPLAQANHMKNVLLKHDKRLKIDFYLTELLYSEETTLRINKYINDI
jgi:hypothetical protein